MIVAQSDFDKQSQIHPGDSADHIHIVENWEFLARQYHNHGYIKAHIEPTATLDRPHGTVSYTVAAVPGPVYTMGRLSVENVADDLRDAIQSAFPLHPGMTFNEGTIRGFFATQGVNPKLERIFRAVNYKYVLHPNDDARTIDVGLRLEKRP
jgi:outer membrane protein assembly factor BamA